MVLYTFGLVVCLLLDVAGQLRCDLFEMTLLRTWKRMENASCLIFALSFAIPDELSRRMVCKEYLLTLIEDVRISGN
jgi:hypothetical protein